MRTRSSWAAHCSLIRQHFARLKQKRQTFQLKERKFAVIGFAALRAGSEGASSDFLTDEALEIGNLEVTDEGSFTEEVEEGRANKLSESFTKPAGVFVRHGGYAGDGNRLNGCLSVTSTPAGGVP
jgi:hypothetical protein